MQYCTAIWVLLVLTYSITEIDALHLGYSPRVEEKTSCLQLGRREALRGVWGTVTAVSVISLNRPTGSWALEAVDPLTRTKSVVPVVIKNAQESIGVQIRARTLQGGRAVVEIERLVQPIDPALQVGMVVKNVSSVQELVQRLTNGPFPLTLEFEDPIGPSTVPTASVATTTTVTADERAASLDSSPSAAPSFREYTRRTLEIPTGACKIQSRKGDVLELEYEAYYWSADGSRKVLYDASSFRGTGQPYQIVLGSGDSIAGLDLGLYDMCPGEVRQLLIPAVAGYGPRARATFKIPLDHRGLEWVVELVSIDATIRKDNNNLTREEREG